MGADIKKCPQFSRSVLQNDQRLLGNIDGEVRAWPLKLTDVAYVVPIFAKDVLLLQTIDIRGVVA
jgi:hypothetical protein